jgi:tetratricopeptide (TPR) repeat protein
LVSLGESCEVAFQLRQHSGDNTAHFFDWLVTPAAGLIRTISENFPPFPPENLSLVKPDDRTGFVIDAVTGMQFPHQFPRRGVLIPRDFLKDYDIFAAKFEHLARRFRETVRSRPVTFVRRDLSREMALELEGVMRARFPTADMRFLYLNGAHGNFDTPLGTSILFPARTSGFGHSPTWARLLEKQSLVAQPYRLATSQIVRASADDYHLSTHVRTFGGALKEGMRRNPENPWFAHELGSLALRQRRFWRARTLAKKALAKDPGNLDFLELRVRAELGMHALSRKEALAEITPLLKNQLQLGLVELAADLMLGLGQTDIALTLLDRALATYPDANGLHLWRAKALLAAGLLEEAEASVDCALALRPDGKAQVELKARMLEKRGRNAEALDLVRDRLRKGKAYRLSLLYVALAVRHRVWRARHAVFPFTSAR